MAVPGDRMPEGAEDIALLDVVPGEITLTGWPTYTVTIPRGA
ncbi:hypothetical protein [Spongiactinospora gelatinilytica]|nr:hypothetical protein [Spongiactinospora gelatinilytica]